MRARPGRADACRGPAIRRRMIHSASATLISQPAASSSARLLPLPGVSPERRRNPLRYRLPDGESAAQADLSNLQGRGGRMTCDALLSGPR